MITPARLIAAVVITLALFALPQPAQAAVRPSLTGLRCVPASTPTCTGGAVRLEVGRKVQLRGKGLKRGMRVTFRWSHGALATRLTKDRTGWTTRIPAGTAPGVVKVTVTDRRGRRSKPRPITVLAPARATTPLARPEGPAPAAFAGGGMWIWELKKADGGDPEAIAMRARLAGIGTVFVKAGDRDTPWSQFSPTLVAALRSRGLRVCAWQFVYGDRPEAEAAVAIGAVNAGADCFVIDAEGQYEGRYAAAAKYLGALRASVGADYPIGLSSFPWVDAHADVPYSVFLGPGGAQVTMPQVYWKDIGASVDAVSARTLSTHRVYGRPIAPTGQLYAAPDAADVRRFRALWAGYGATGLSWWSWQHATAGDWSVLAEPALPALVASDPGWPGLGVGSRGDLVVAMQQRLASAEASVAIDGEFGPGTQSALKRFQSSRGLPATGETDAATWQALLRLDVTPRDWS